MLKNFNPLFLFIVSFLLVFSSCSINKKMYSSGYHVEWYKNAVASRKQKIRIAAKIPKQKTLPNNSLNTSKTLITKGENKIFVSQLSSKNLISHEEIVRTKINFFQKILLIDSLKTSVQKNNLSQNNDTAKSNQRSITSTISIVLGILLLVFLLATKTSAYFTVGPGIILLLIGLYLLFVGIFLKLKITAPNNEPITPEDKIQKKAANKIVLQKIGKGLLFILLVITLLFLYLFIIWCLIFLLPYPTLEVGVAFLLLIATLFVYLIILLSRKIKQENISNQ